MPILPVLIPESEAGRPIAVKGSVEEILPTLAWQERTLVNF